LSTFVKTYANSSNCNSISAASFTNQNASVSSACVDDFIKGFGLRALRRPVTTQNNSIDASSTNSAADNDLTFYRAVYADASNGGFDSLITAMLISPDSLFLTQFKGSPSGSDPNQIVLSNYELASKLAYYYTDSTPDLALLQAATSGFVGASNTVQAQSARLFQLASAQNRFTNFYTQWIRPNAVPNLVPTINSPSSDINALATLRNESIQEMIDLTNYYTFNGGKFSDIINSDVSFAKSQDLANIYGVQAWNGSTSALVHFPASNPRSGLFTRAGFAFSGGRDNNLIIRGARIRKDYLCMDISTPANVNPVLVPSTSVSNLPPTIRNIVEASTEVQGTSCITCHQNYINPLGYALENYDAFGRFHTSESLYDSNNVVTSSVAIDSSSTPHVTQNDPTSVNNGVQYSNFISQTPELNSCFVRHYFRFSQARLEDNSADGCLMRDMMNALDNSAAGASIQSMVNVVVGSNQFQTRRISP
jgi:hypothetical protein